MVSTIIDNPQDEHNLQPLPLLFRKRCQVFDSTQIDDNNPDDDTADHGFQRKTQLFVSDPFLRG